MMKEILQTLKITYWSSLCGSLLFAAIVHFLLLSGDEQVEEMDETLFIFQTVSVMITLFNVPVSLKLMKFKFVAQRLQARPEESYRTYSLVRIILLSGTLLFNVVCYYLYPMVSFVYLALIVLVAFLFIYPSESRLHSELDFIQEK